MAARKPEGIVGDAAKAAAKKAAEAAKKAAVKKAAAEAKAKAAKKAVTKTTKKAASKANPRNSYALGRTVVHASPTRGLKKITPHKGSAALPDETVAFFWDPKDFGKRGSILLSSQEYMRGTGSAYVGKVPRSSYKKTQHGIGASYKPIKVKKEIVGDNQNFSKNYKELDKALLRAGVIKKPTKAGAKSKAKKVVSKAETVARKNKTISKKLSKYQNRNSIV
jgi:hypothetical protein